MNIPWNDYYFKDFLQIMQETNHFDKTDAFFNLRGNKSSDPAEVRWDFCIVAYHSLPQHMKN